jgi:hypothetical protein
MHHFLTNHHYQRESVTILLANTDTTLSETNNHPRSIPLPRESRISLQINGPNMGETWLWQTGRVCTLSPDVCFGRSEAERSRVAGGEVWIVTCSPCKTERKRTRKKEKNGPTLPWSNTVVMFRSGNLYPLLARQCNAVRCDALGHDQILCQVGRRSIGW